MEAFIARPTASTWPLSPFPCKFSEGVTTKVDEHSFDAWRLKVRASIESAGDRAAAQIQVAYSQTHNALAVWNALRTNRDGPGALTLRDTLTASKLADVTVRVLTAKELPHTIKMAALFGSDLEKIDSYSKKVRASMAVNTARYEERYVTAQGAARNRAGGPLSKRSYFARMAHLAVTRVAPELAASDAAFQRQQE